MTQTTSTNQLTVAVIGAGAFVYGMHRPGLADPRFKIVAICDIDAAKLAARAAEIGCPAYQDHRDLLADVRPELAVVMTPHPAHASIAIDCLQAGVHVLVEKPISVHAAEADAMIEAARRADRLLAVNLQQRFRPEVMVARRVIDEGRLGRIQSAHMIVAWPRTRRYFANAGWRGTWRGEGGGVLLNQAPHNLDLICHLVGLPKRVVAWNRTTMHDIETEDTVQAMLEWPNGAVGSLHVSTAEAGQPERLEILGTRGRLEVTRGGVHFQQFAEELESFFATTDRVYDGPDLHEIPLDLPATTGSHQDVYTNIHAAITQGASLMATGESGRMSLELANAMILSSYTKMAVDLPIDRVAYIELLTSLQASSRFI